MKDVDTKPGFAVHYSQSVRLAYAFAVAISIYIFSFLSSLAKSIIYNIICSVETLRFTEFKSSKAPFLRTALMLLCKISAIPIYIHNIIQQRGYLHCNVCLSVQ